MISWPSPSLPSVPGTGAPLRIFDTQSSEVRQIVPGPVASMYVCGITPYDATHIGHAATYVTFDLVGRVLRDCGHRVTYVQNVTDVDEPLFERAERDGIDWADLALAETALFREDMTALQVIAPDHYIGAVESIPQTVAAVETMLANGTAYLVAVPDGDGRDVYFDTAQPGFGQLSSLPREEMLALFAERGGDPDREGKRDALDPLLWRAARDGEPSWPGGSLGPGRPGWHIECTSIALEYLGMPFDIQGGGTDLIFPHHEMSAAHGEAVTGTQPFARTYVHQAMVGLHGAKMSKSQGNLVLVSQLRADGVHPMALRLALLAHHYRSEWDWSDAVLADAERRLAAWHAGFAGNGGPPAEATVARIRACLSDDLDSAGALAAVDRWAQEAVTRGGDDIGAPGLVSRAVDALLGVRF